jgi:nitrite reductase (NO-forming)
MHDGSAGQPGWLMPWFTLTRSVMAVQPALWAYAIALVETGIAIAVLLGLARKATYIGGALWTLMIWATAEGLGRTAPGAIATDIGTGVIYTVAFLALLAADRCAETRPYSLDAVIERRVPWWRRIAEIGG